MKEGFSLFLSLKKINNIKAVKQRQELQVKAIGLSIDKTGLRSVSSAHPEREAQMQP